MFWTLDRSKPKSALQQFDIVREGFSDAMIRTRADVDSQTGLSTYDPRSCAAVHLMVRTKVDYTSFSTTGENARWTVGLERVYDPLISLHDEWTDWLSLALMQSGD